MPTTAKLLEKVILKTVQRYIEKRLLGFSARHSTTLQYKRLTDHVILNVNNNISMVAVVLDIEKSFDTSQHLGLAI